MTTIAWLAIFAGILVARQVSRGRLSNLTEDLGDAFIAFASGDTDALGVVLSRKGDDATPSVATFNAGALGEATAGALDGIGDAVKNDNIANVAVVLGSKAKGYRWTATGPDYYDCSGLMWRAAQAVGFKGSRFSTASFPGVSGFKRISAPATQGPGVTSAAVGDLCVWPAGRGGVTGHMGVVTGGNKFYSARSVRSGIGESSISGFRGGRVPDYYRYTGTKKG